MKKRSQYGHGVDSTISGSVALGSPSAFGGEGPSGSVLPSEGAAFADSPLASFVVAELSLSDSSPSGGLTTSVGVGASGRATSL